MVTLDTMVQRSTEFLFSNVDDEYLAVDPTHGYCYSFNVVSLKIWEFLADPVSIRQLCQQLEDTFTVEQAICQQDVLELLEKFLQDGLIHTEK